MRKILFSLLLATTVATPALARPGMGDRGDRSADRQEQKADHSDRSEAREQRSQVREERSQAREQRSDAREQRSQVREQRPQMQQERMDIRQRIEARQAPMQRSERPVREIVRERAVRDSRPVMPAANVNERGRPTLGQRPDARGSTNWRDRTVTPQQVERRQDAREGVNNWRGERDVRQQRLERRADRNRIRPPAGARPDRPAPAPQTAYRDSHHSRWRTDWRHDHRYNWRDYRHHHRSLFRLGIYFDPFGWNYRRYDIGWRLWPSYYSSNYWLTDPYMYRLPYAPFPYRWVRYYDDALLVNTYTGQVVDVMYDFFW